MYGHGAWDEDRIGMTVLKKWNPWDDGGPLVFHSEWWIREHWGRAFEILALELRDLDEPEGHGAVLLRPRPVHLTPVDLERPADDARELAALMRNLEELHREAADLFAQLSRVTASHEQLARNLEGLEAEVGELRTELTRIAQSQSWRLTAPLRATRRALRRQNG